MIRHALLALLRDRSDYGYSLKHRFDERIGCAWQLNVGQVYQTLQALTQSALIREIGPRMEPCPGRRVFEITPKGVRALERWLRRPVSQVRPVRDEVLLRLLCLEPGQYAALIPEIDLLERAARHRLDELRLRRTRAARDGDGAPLARLALAAEILQEAARVEWLDHCRTVLASCTAGATSPRPAPS